MIKMVKIEDENHYIPEECCSFTNPMTTPSGKSEIDDYEMPCGHCCGDCDECITQKIFDEYAKVTNQISE